MGRASFERFTEIKIVTVLGGGFFRFFSFHHFGLDNRLSLELVAHQVARTFVFADLFGQDVAGPFQGVFLIFYVTFHKSTHFGSEVVFFLHHQQ